MAHFDNNIKVKGAKERSSIDLSCTHVTTSDFNVIKPVYIKELVPGDSFYVNTSHVCRAQSMACPTFGRIDITTRAFFVPYRLAWKHFNDFYAQRPIATSATTTQVLSSVPHIDANTFIDRICVSGNGFVTLGSSSSFDIRIHASNNTSYYSFTTLGRRLVDLLYCLGYKFNYDIAPTTASSTNFDVSLLPLLAWIKMFRDWFIPTQYQHLHNIDYFFNKYDSYTSTDIANLLNIVKYMLYRYYNDDFASASLVRPYSSRSDGSSVSLILEQDYSTAGEPKGTSHTDVISNPQVGASQSGTYAHSPWQYRAMMNIASLLQKYNLLSPRINDWLNAQFGIKSGAVRFDITEYLGSKVTPLQISDVTNTTSIESAELYGKGFSKTDDEDSSSLRFDYSSDEFGILIVTNELAPRYGYVDGIKPEVDHINLSDFFTPDYDALGYDVVCRKHISSASPYGKETSPSSNWDFKHNNVFGYLPKYGLGYKFGFDSLTGDFKVRSLNAGLDSWELYRHIGNFSGAFDNNEDFRYGSPRESENFDRIFIDQNRDNDHFILIFGFDVKASRPMLALNASWQVNIDHEENQGHEVENHGNLT